MGVYGWQLMIRGKHDDALSLREKNGCTNSNNPIDSLANRYPKSVQYLLHIASRPHLNQF